MLNTHKDVFELLSTAPESQIDPKVCEKLATLATNDYITPNELLEILDECAYYALASDFAMKAMNVVLYSLVQEEQEVDRQT